MNSYERLFSRLDGKSVDKIPNLSIFMGFAAKNSGISYRDFCLNPKSMVEANMFCRKNFGADIVTVMSDPYGEAVDYGLSVDFPEDSNPLPRKDFWKGQPNVDSIPSPQIDETTRMKSRVETIKLYSDALKNECPISGWVEGIVAEYCDLRGINDALLDMADGENFLADIFEKLTEQAIYYAKEQVRAGADIIGIGDAACSIIGLPLYRKYGFPYEKRIIDAVHEAGALVKLHICGNTTFLLNDIALLKPDIFDVDSMVDFAVASNVLKEHSLVSGNIDPVGVLLEGTPEMVKTETYKCIEQGGNTCCISGGCETPVYAKSENIKALNECLYR